MQVRSVAIVNHWQRLTDVCLVARYLSARCLSAWGRLALERLALGRLALERIVLGLIVLGLNAAPVWAQFGEPVRTAARNQPIGMHAPLLPQESNRPQDANAEVEATERLRIEVASELEADSGMIVDSSATSLTLESLESMALAANPSIRRAAALVAAARGRALQAGLSPNPEVGIDFQQLGSDGRAEQYGIGVSQEVVVPQKLRLDRSIALHEAARLSQELAAQRQRVLTDVRLAYVRALRADRQLELTQQLVEIGEKGVEVTGQLLQAQEASRADLLQAELEVETANILYENARNARLRVWRELGAVIGQPDLTPQPLAGDIEQLPSELLFDESLAQIQRRSPEVAAVLAKIDQARCDVQRQLIEIRPNVTVAGLFNWRDNGIDGDSDGGLAVSVPIPVLNQNQGAIREARYRLAAAQRELEQLELGLSQRLAPVFERYSNAVEQVDRFRNRILPRTRETLELMRQSYQLGEVGYVNLLTVQRTYAQNQLAYLDAIESLRLAEAEIAGLLLSGSLEPR